MSDNKRRRASSRQVWQGVLWSLGLALTLGLWLVPVAGCDSSWRTDMWYQASHGPEESPRPEPAKSVPLGAVPDWQDRDDTEDLPNPVPADPSSLARGDLLFQARCAPCHGLAGHGDGPVSKFFPPAPDFAYRTIRKRTDGFLFGTITLGGKAMPSQREGLTLRDRWDLVNHVREVQRSSPPVEPPTEPTPAASADGASG